MFRTTLMAGVAATLMMAAPAVAQDAMTPAQPDTTQPAPASLQLTPGSTVRGSDGQALGQLEGVRDNAGEQELTVRGADGQLRGVPLGGIRQDGADVVVGWTRDQFAAAAAITGDSTTAPVGDQTMDPAGDGVTPPATTPPADVTRTTPPATPATPPGSTDPMIPPSSADPATPPNTANPPPGEAPTPGRA